MTRIFLLVHVYGGVLSYISFHIWQICYFLFDSMSLKKYELSIHATASTIFILLV